MGEKVIGVHATVVCSSEREKIRCEAHAPETVVWASFCLIPVLRRLGCECSVFSIMWLYRIYNCTVQPSHADRFAARRGDRKLIK